MKKILAVLFALSLSTSVFAKNMVATIKNDSGFNVETEILCIDGFVFVFHLTRYGGGLAQMLDADGKPRLCEIISSGKARYIK